MVDGTVRQSEGNTAMHTLKTLGLATVYVMAMLGSATTRAENANAAAATTRVENQGSVGAVEEVLVTGSYLKQTAADSPSPLSIISSAYIEDIGAVNVSQIVQTMP